MNLVVLFLTLKNEVISKLNPSFFINKNNNNAAALIKKSLLHLIQFVKF